MKKILGLMLCSVAIAFSQGTYTAYIVVDDIYWQVQNEWNAEFHAVLLLDGDSVASASFTHDWYMRENGVGEFAVHGTHLPEHSIDEEANQYYETYVRINVSGYGIVQSNTLMLIKEGDPEEVELLSFREDGTPLTLYDVPVALWTGYQWNSHHHFMSDGELVKVRYNPSLGEKFYRGEDEQGDILYENYASYPIDYDDPLNTLVFRHRQQANAAVRSSVDGAYGASDFRDPWFEGQLGVGGEYRSDGISAGFKSVPYDQQNPYNLGINTNYRGVFLNENATFDTTKPLYRVRAPIMQQVQGQLYHAIFQGWSYNGNDATLQQVGSNPAGYDQKAVVFKNTGATVTALYTTTNITWNVTIPAGTYTMAGNLTVASGATLTLSPGTTLQFPNGTKLTVNGVLVANGTSGQRITFTKSSTSWTGLEFSGSGANGSSITYATISNATQPVKATNVSSFAMSNDSIRNAAFYDAALQFYGSNPTISDIAIIGQAGASNGVRFAGSGGTGSNGSLSLSTIRTLGSGNGIVVQGNSSPVIRSNLIENNLYHGIVVDNNGSGVPLIIANTVRDNVQNYTNIHVKYYSTARLGSNSVRGGYFGFYWENGSSSNTYWTGSYDYLAGQNSARANVHGVRAGGYCNVWFGDYDLFHGEPIYYGACNTIDSASQYKASSVDHSWILAEGNWWGTYPPNQLYWDGTSTLSTGHPLESVNCPSGGIQFAAGGGSAPSMGEGSVTLAEALAAVGRGEYPVAKEAFSDILQTSSDEELRIHAAIGLLEVNRMGKDLSVIPILESLARAEGEVGPVVSEVLLSVYSSLGRFSDVKHTALDICGKYPGTKHEKNALYALASLKWFDESQQETSAKYLTELLAKYGSSIDDATLAVLGVSRFGSEGMNTTVSAGEDQLEISNFPNPFNPSTTITFTLPEDGRMVLRVYDILGRVVGDLIDGPLAAGKHQRVFDASKLPSGIYFYKLDFSASGGGGKSISKKFVLAK